MHVHVPAGAIPKDGPSAGVTMAAAMASELTGRPVRGDVAMTGELTLSGRVLPVGGIKEKVLAAKRVGIREVILPRQNAKNINEDLTPELRQDLIVHLVSTIDEVLALALLPVSSDLRSSEIKRKKDDGKGGTASAAARLRTCLLRRVSEPQLILLLGRLDLGDQPARRRIPPWELDAGCLANQAAAAIALDQRQRIRGLEVDNLTARDHRPGVGDGHRATLDVLVIVRLVRRIGWRRLQVGNAEKDQLLVAVTGRWIPRAEPFHTLGDAADFFLAFAPGSGLGGFIRVQTPRRKLPQFAIDRRPVLPDQDETTVVFQRDENDRR